VPSLINDAVQLNIVRIGSKPIEFLLDIDENLPSRLFGDELRLKQVLNNLLSNGIKYTEKGYVKLSVDHTVHRGEATLRFIIRDTGQGMKPDDLKDLFSEYSRFNAEANRATEGTGIGLSIARKIVEMMGGTITAESIYGLGSAFTVEVRQKTIDCEPIGPELADRLRNFTFTGEKMILNMQVTREPMPYGSVLVVDDVETNIYVAKGLLSPYRLKIDSAESGFAAIDKIKNGRVYDIIFMDHMMPDLDGIETVKIIRGMGYTRSIVALTANAVAGQAEIFLGNGFDDFLSKPIDIRRLNIILNKLIRDKQKPEVIEAARKQIAEDTANSKNSVSAQIIEIFLRDANKTLAVLEKIAESNSYSDEDNLRSYIINIHGIKGALANIGKMNLSAIALKLEAAGREGKLETVSSETPAFLKSLKALIKELTPESEDEEIAAADDIKLLKEKLLIIKNACENYDESTAETALEKLREKSWTPQVKDLLIEISEHLLHSDFEEAAKKAGRYAVDCI
jgi:CheY-like chemotaxis protein